MLAPIVLDMNSGAQRAHAVETVDAYCATHNLHLVAVIVLPPSAPVRMWEPVVCASTLIYTHPH